MSLPRRLVHNEYDLQELAETQDRPIELIERDFALVTLAAHLTDRFPEQLCFKGGFVLRHVRGSGRFSADLDATRTNPPRHKLAAGEIAEAMRRASDEPMLRIDPGEPATDSPNSLDFDRIAFHTPHSGGRVAVEISYREAVVDEPEWVLVGPPYYAQFQIPVLTLAETVAEKLRTLLQRRRATDLSDLALILTEHANQLDRARVRELALVKFELVKQGDRRGRIEANLGELRAGYEQSIGGLDPDAPPFAEAQALVLDALASLLP
ncbi:MAG TPA: nucleotidyl transferase AbiEii/AbiGii toxin family protein [Solirubrobacteraceae bacterium]|nr:nucleotidyl transferase AbiEii/AbiGii toxin family protein [Solirubrobacteraceae bacterium]